MASRNIRKDRVDSGIIILADNTTIPAGYTRECGMDSKYVKQVPTGGTNPGCSVGAATHTHASASAHTHTPSSSGHCHTHTVTVSATSSNQQSQFGGQWQGSLTSHTHTKSSNSTNPALTVSTDNAHSHAAACSTVPNTTIRFLRKSTGSFSLRRPHVPLNALVLWTKNNCLIPNDYTADATLINEYLKGVPNACASPLCASSCNSHTHATPGNHTHTLTVASHTHTVPGTWGAGAARGLVFGLTTLLAAGHTHSIGISVTSIGGNNTSGSAGHTHTTSSLELSRVEVNYIQKTSINLRKRGVAKDASVMFLGLLACIPSEYLLMDGTTCTLNILDRFIKGIPTACTNPGSTTGSSSHTHTDGHTHSSVSVTHVHAGTGSSGGGTGAGCQNPNQPGSPVAATGHTHPFSSTDCKSQAASLNSGCHTHASVDHKPSTKEVAIIQRI